MTISSLQNPLLTSRGPSVTRTSQKKPEYDFPNGLEIISADSHWEISEDIFYPRFPEEIRELAPRVWFDRYWRHGYPEERPIAGKKLAEDDERSRIISTSLGRGAWDFEVRTKDMFDEGIAKEIVYPQSLLAFLRHPNRAVQESIYRIYNEYIAALGVSHQGRFFGVGICSNWWDPAKARSAIQQIVDLGLKTFMIPTTNTGTTADGKEITLGSEEMDTFWSEAADARLPVSFHIGEPIKLNGRGQLGATIFQSFDPFRKPMGDLIFGGVLDRHPNLRLVFAEGGIGWVPSALQDAEMVLDTHYSNLDVIPKLRPTDYWHKNFFATFQTDPLGLRLIDYVGAGRVMWGSDYPHNESTLGYSWSAVKSILDAVGEDRCRAIVGGNAKALYGL